MDNNVPSWDRYFMDIAVAVSKRSKDPSTKVGAVIVDDQKHVIATGYNGMPPGGFEDEKLWERPTKYDYVIHAEVNAFAHALADVSGATLYVTLFPCKECAKTVAAHGIRRIVFLSDRTDNPISRKTFDMAGIELYHLK